MLAWRRTNACSGPESAVSHDLPLAGCGPAAEAHSSALNRRISMVSKRKWELSFLLAPSRTLSFQEYSGTESACCYYQ